MQNPEKITRGLIIREPWIGMILRGEKVWEMRSASTKVRGPIALIASGTGQIVGIATVEGTVGPMSQAQVAFNQARHKIPHDMIESGQVAKWNTAWVLKDVKPLDRPLPYKHPSGAVIWVTLDEETRDSLARAVEGKPAAPKIAPRFK